MSKEGIINPLPSPVGPLTLLQSQDISAGLFASETDKMILQRPKRKNVKQVKKNSANANNRSGSLPPSHALLNGSPQILPQEPNGNHGSTRHGKLPLPFEPTPPRSLPRATGSSRVGSSKAPILAPYFSSPPPVQSPVYEHGVGTAPHHFIQEPALYDLIYSKFDAVITSIDEESFSGDQGELGR